MMKYIIPIIGLIILAVIAVFTGGVSLVPSLPFIILCLQRLGVFPK